MMKPSSIAWRISYLWNDRGGLSSEARRVGSSGRPKSIMVECFGVAVKAKCETFAGRARDFWISPRSSSTDMPAMSCVFDRASVACSFEAVAPVCEVCASSMITAKDFSFSDRSVRIASIA